MENSLQQAYEAFVAELGNFPQEEEETRIAFAFWSGWKAAGGTGVAPIWENEM